MKCHSVLLWSVAWCVGAQQYRFSVTHSAREQLVRSTLIRCNSLWCGQTVLKIEAPWGLVKCHRAWQE